MRYFCKPMSAQLMANPLVLAMSHLQAGRLHQAEVICQDVLHRLPGEPDALHMLGVIAQRAGRLAAAAEFTERAISHRPEIAAYHNSLGNALQLLGRHAEACEAYARAIRLRPELAETHANLGQSLRDLGRMDESIAVCEAAVRLKPGYAKGHNQLGLSLKRKESLEQAIAAFDKAIELDAKLAEAHNNLGGVYAQMRRYDPAIESFRRAIALDSSVAGYHCNLGNALLAINQTQEAAEEMMEAVRLDPIFADAYNSLGSILLALERPDEALEYLDQALRLRPESAAAHTNRGVAMREMGRPDEALIAHLNAIRLDPSAPEPRLNLAREMFARGKFEDAIACYRELLQLHPRDADGYNHLGGTLNRMGRFDESLANFERAIELCPNFPAARWNRGLHRLLHGDLERGFADYEWRSQRHRPLDRFDRGRPFWDGSDPAGKTILLRWEQGLGDSIQCIRYVPMIADRGGKVIFSGKENLHELLGGVRGLAGIATPENEPAEFDFHLPVMSLPNIFKTTLDSIPVEVPYLAVNPEKSRIWRDRMSGEANSLAVGIAWAGSPQHKEDRDRSMRLSMFAPLGKIANVKFYSLQKGEAGTQAKENRELKLIDLTDELHDLSDTAAMMENLDLVISVDTSVAHLAGALARPVWTLLPIVPDWRWMLNRSDSPWYPTMRLFRQKSAGDWDGVVAAVAEQLTAAVRSRSLSIRELRGEMQG
jgi:tetratricopeptide (TPR) repeat protein